MSKELYRKRYIGGLLVVCGLLLGFGASGASQARPEPVRTLLVDETQTLQASLLVNAMAAALQETGLFAIEAVFPEVESSFDDPLGENTTGRVYEMIVIVPREEELRALRQIWIATCPLTHETRPEILQGVELIQRMLEERARGLLRALSVRDDALPGYFAALFEKHGWLRCP
jgi:hypothetical protein